MANITLNIEGDASLVCTAALLDKMRVSAKMFNRCGLPFSLQKCPFECVTSTENAQNEQERIRTIF